MSFVAKKGTPKPMRRLFWALFCVSFSACTASHVATGKDYLGQGKLAMAIEYFDAGLVDEPDDAALRDAMIMAQQQRQFELRRDINQLKDSKHNYLAIPALTLLTDSALRAKQFKLAGEDPADLKKETKKIFANARDELIADLDSRSNRANARPNDLRRCRQLQAIGGDDDYIARTCDNLLQKFKHYAQLQAGTHSYVGTQDVLGDLRESITAYHPELLEIVDKGHERHSAMLYVFLAEPKHHDSGWVLYKRDAFHDWVPRKDRSGNQIVDKITVKPSKSEIKKARKAGKKAPKAKVIKKKVWDQVQGDFRYYIRTKKASIPYVLVLSDLRQQKYVAAFAGEVEKKSEAKYFEYTGNQEIKSKRKIQNSGGEGRPRRNALARKDTLLREVYKDLPKVMSEQTIKRVE